MPVIKLNIDSINAEVERIKLNRRSQVVETPQAKIKKHMKKYMGEIGSERRLKQNEARRVMRKMKWFKGSEGK